jgi:hypothetical protein
VKLSQPLPAYQISVVRLQCVTCGAEANAACTCGKPYLPRLRAAEAVAAHPEKSNRAIADEIGVSEPTVRRAREATASGDAVDEARTGRDGRTRRHPRYDPGPKPIIQYDLIEQTMAMIKQMDPDTWARFDRMYQKARDNLGLIPF